MECVFLSTFSTMMIMSSLKCFDPSHGDTSDEEHRDRSELSLALAVDDRKQINGCYIEQWSTREGCCHPSDISIYMIEEDIRDGVSDRCWERKSDKEEYLCRASELTLAKYRSKRKWDRYLVYCYTKEDRISDCLWESYPRTDPESIEESMDKNRHEWYECYMIEVLMWILMVVIPMRMIVWVWSDELLDKIDDKKSSDKCIDSILSLFERFGEDMYQCDRKHRSCAEGDEEIERSTWDRLASVEYESTGWDEGEDKEGEKHGIVDRDR